MRFATSSLVAALTAVLVAAQPLIQESPVDVPESHLPAPQTNAERFAAGLPPLPPRSRHSRAPHGGSKAATARRSTVSPGVSVNVKCNILVKKTSGSSLGYIPPNWSFGMYGSTGFQPTQAGALEVGLSYVPSDPASLSQVDMVATNSPNSAYPYVGAVSTFQEPGDIGPYSINWLVMGGTTQTPKGTRSVATGTSVGNAYGTTYKAESAVWKYDPITQAITAQWINSDGSSPATYLTYSGGLLRMTGSLDMLEMMYGEAEPVTLTCVPSATS